MAQEEKYEARFYFISDISLRKNLADALQYVTKLTSFYGIYENEKELQISFCKTIILYTGSILEACLHFCLKNKTKGILFEKEKDWKYKEPKLIYKVPEAQEEIVWARRKKMQKKIDFRHIKFQQLNKSCFECGILNQNLFKMCEKIRNLRNKIHIANLSKPDSRYDRRRINSLFEMTSKILSAVEKELT